MSNRCAQALPFAEDTFDAIISIDAMNHFYNRAGLRRLASRPASRRPFPLHRCGHRNRHADPRRNPRPQQLQMGVFIFTPKGVQERFIEAAGFVDLQVEDVTETIATVTKRWHDSREKRREELSEIERRTISKACRDARCGSHTRAPTPPLPLRLPRGQISLKAFARRLLRKHFPAGSAQRSPKLFFMWAALHANATGRKASDGNPVVSMRARELSSCRFRAV